MITIEHIEKLLSLFIPDREKLQEIITLINGFIHTNSSGLYVKPSSAATMLDCKEDKIVKLMKSGKLKAKRMESGHIRIYRSSIEKYMESLPDAFHNKEQEIKDQVDKLFRDGIL